MGGNRNCVLPVLTLFMFRRVRSIFIKTEPGRYDSRKLKAATPTDRNVLQLNMMLLLIEF